MFAICRLFVVSTLVTWVLATHEHLPQIKGMQWLSITCDTEEKLSFVLQYEGKRGFEFLKVTRHPPENVQVLVTLDQAANFKKLLKFYGIEYKIYIQDVQKIFDEESKAQKRAERRRRRSLVSKLPYSFNYFPRHDVINEYLAEMSIKYKDITLFDMGSSYEGRKIFGVKISSSENETKPAILIDAGIHAREWIAPTTALFAISQLVKEENKNLYENVDWYIVPSMNPDGYEFSHTNYRLWRKTRSNTTIEACKGVDGNRNFDYKWMFLEPGSYVRASNYPCDNIYAGPKAFSEVETRNLRDFVLSQNGTIKAYLNLHSTSSNSRKLLLLPWAYTQKIPTNYKILMDVAERAARGISSLRGTNYTVGISSHIYYNAPGASIDWAMAIGKSDLSYAIELPSIDFAVSPKQIKPIGLELFEAFKIFAKHVETNYVY